MKPSLETLKLKYKRTILELANGERAVIIRDYYDELKVVELYECRKTDTDHVDFLEYLYDDEGHYKIKKMYFCTSDEEYLYHILNPKSKIDWSWTDEEAEEMTLSEVCKALGKNIKIIKE